MNEQQPDLDNWNEFLGSWLKAEHISTFPATVFVNQVKAEYADDDEAQLILEISYSGKKYKFQPNKTNIGILREKGIKSPKELSGKSLIFKEVMNFNPSLKKKVPSLEIQDVK